MNGQFRYLTNLETSFRMVRWLAIIAVVGSLAFALGVAYWAFAEVSASRQKVYVLDNGKSIMVALAQEQNINRPAEAKDHIKTFHRLFFTLEPDEKQVEGNIREATYLGDRSVVRLYQDLQEAGYYGQLIQGNVHQKVEIDKVEVNFSQSPYRVVTSGRQLLIRANNITIRKLVTECYLIDVARTDNNPHGFMIERFKVVQNQDIETVQRSNQNTNL
ncbi:conjugative transposon protein TraK [Fibrella arboris]|uniref:conjugative transposon protein TraK n=1 Tax=Fibrella arboris TaxID=3242486 RepID=UPI00352072FD